MNENVENSGLSNQHKQTYKCSKCKDIGWIIENGTVKARCECYDLNIAENLFRASGIKDDYYTFNNFQTWNESSEKLKNTALKYYRNFNNIKNDRRNSIAFLGQVGGGKTHLTVAIGLNLLRQKKQQVIYLPYRDTITYLKQCITDEETYQKEIYKYQSSKILLIDDLLKGKKTESDVNILFEIINHRYINSLPIIVSSEYGIEDLLNFDEAIGSRIYEMCKDYIVEINKDIKNNYRLK